MDILFVRNLFRPKDFGGNRYPWEVTRRLARRHRVRVLTPRPGGPLPGPTAATVRHYPVSRRTPPETFLTNAISARVAIEREIRRARPDVVVLSSYDVAYGYAALARPGIPSVFIYHSSFHSTAVERLAAGAGARRLAHVTLRRFVAHVERLVFERSDAIVAVSPFSRAEIAARLGREDPRVRLIPTGVDVELFSPGDRLAARRHLAIARDAHVLLTVGRLAPVKRYDRAIEALALLRGQHRDVQLIIVGTGPTQHELRRLAVSRGLGDHVRFVGFADGEHLRDLYRAADLVLCTSEFENWSLALLEAFACGTPVIGTPRGGTPELLTSIDPRLVAANVEPAALAACAFELLRDSTRRRELGRMAREFVVARFAWERTVSELDVLFAQVASRSP